jgi:RimJ/RimL family protein N-acetyltransferase
MSGFGAPLYQPDLGPRGVVLPDGSRAVVRALASGEAALVQQVFDGLGDESRRQRFAGAKPRLSERDLELLSAVDKGNHEALVALEPETGIAVAEARVVRDRSDARVGEIAFAVTDAWQNRRLGTYLAKLLACRARELGMVRLRATILADNSRSKALLLGMGRVVGRRYEQGAVELEIALD